MRFVFKQKIEQKQKTLNSGGGVKSSNEGVKYEFIAQK